MYQTYDLSLAAYLILKGNSVESVTLDGKHRAAFTFKGFKENDKEILTFYNRKAKVEPVAFLQQIKSLKAMISSK